MTTSVQTLLLACDRPSLPPPQVIEQELPELQVLVANNQEQLIHYMASTRPSAVVLSDRFDQSAAAAPSHRLAPWPWGVKVIYIADAGEGADGTLGAWKTVNRPVDLDELLQLLKTALNDRPAGRLQDTGRGAASHRLQSPPLVISSQDRHEIVNRLAFLLTSLRALEADLLAEAEDPRKVREFTNDYIDRMVSTVHIIAAMVARNRDPRSRIGHE